LRAPSRAACRGSARSRQTQPRSAESVEGAGPGQTDEAPERAQERQVLVPLGCPDLRPGCEQGSERPPAVRAAPADEVVAAANGLPAAWASTQLLPGPFGEGAERALGLLLPLVCECEPQFARLEPRARLVELAGGGGERRLELGARAFLGFCRQAALEQLDDGGVEAPPPFPRASLECPLDATLTSARADPPGHLRGRAVKACEAKLYARRERCSGLPTKPISGKLRALQGAGRCVRGDAHSYSQAPAVRRKEPDRVGPAPCY
jgi:hypothetical protein